MNETQQRIAIAEFCNVMKWSYTLPNRTIHRNVPDYLNDRDAIIFALEYLPEHKIDDFGKNLLMILYLSNHVDGYYFTGYSESELRGSPSLILSIVKSTPQQLAEAFLRTLGLWKDPS